MPKNNLITFGSLFSGIGGFDLGFERAGMQCKWQCEIDKKAQAVLRRHFEGVKLYDDVRSITRDAEPVDLICGGFPCQDLSIAGKRKGLAGERSGLWYEFHRVLSEIKPKWAVIENVAGLLSSDRGRDFAIILSGLADIGYCAAWRVLDSQYFGVAQRRRRVFIVASFGSGSCAEILFEREGVRWDTPARGEAGEENTVTFTIRTGSEGGGKGYLGVDNQTMTIGGQPQYVMSSGQANAEITENVSPSLTLLHEQPILNGVRRLTPTECERLQGFPDGWTERQPDSARYKQLGNAVTVNVAEWLGRRIVDHAKE